MARVMTDQGERNHRSDRSLHKASYSSGLQLTASFCPLEAVDPFDTVEWELRSAQIKDENGELLFEQRDCEIPAGWSQLATNVVVSKYFYGEVETTERESSVRQLIHRVTRTIADWAVQDGYLATKEDGEVFYRDLTWLCLHQHGAFNSPVWFNVGLHHQYGVTGARCNWHWNRETARVEMPENPYEYPQASACFIQSVNDNMEDIMRLATSEAMLFEFGSGTGTDLSTLRSHREKLSGGGKPSGPLSFMRVYDQIAAVVSAYGGHVHLHGGRNPANPEYVVVVRQGFSPAERLEVATLEGKRSVSRVFVGRENAVRRMTPNGTGLELTGTLEHPVLVLTPEFRLVEAIADVAGDRVAVDRQNGLRRVEFPDSTGFHVRPGAGRSAEGDLLLARKDDAELWIAWASPVGRERLTRNASASGTPIRTRSKIS